MMIYNEIRQNLEKWLLEDYSLATAQRIANLANTDDIWLHELVQVVTSSDNLLCQRAAWSVGRLAKINPQVFIPYLHDLIAQLYLPRHNAVHRSIVHVLELIDIPEKWWGDVADACFRFLENPQQPVAIRAFSMTALAKIVKNVPELAPDLRYLLEQNFEHEKPAFRSRARKILKNLPLS